MGVPPEQVAARVPEFERRAGHYFQNWDSLLEQWKIKVRATIDEMEALTFESLPDMVPFEDIVTGKAKDGSEVLMENYDRLIQLCYQNWQYHFEFLNLGYLAYLDFFGFCKEVFPGIPDQAIAKMVQGVDMELFRPDDELKKLAKLAVELGLEAAFADTDDVEGTLRPHRRRGRRDAWVAPYEAAQDPWFNFTVGNGFYGHDKYWLEHQEIPLGYIKDYIRRLGEGHEIMRPVDAAHRREGPGRGGVPRPARRGAACSVRRQASASPPRRTPTSRTTTSTSSTGRWASSGARSASSARCSWTPASGATATTCSTSPAARSATRSSTWSPAGRWALTPTGPHYWPAEIERRRGIIDALSTARPQPALNTPPAEITEPFTMMLYGITTEQVQQWLADGEEGHDGSITGMAASPGVVEGIARVVHSADQLGEVQEGDILVATITAPSWGPIFGKIKATVTDIGGMMSHAAIVCREYGLPAVTGTGNGSTTIRTGQRVRVDGNTGRVEILD